MKRQKTASWRTKLLVMLLAFALLPAIGVAYVASNTMEEAMEQTMLDGLSALARAKSSAIDQFMEIRRKHVERMTRLVGDEVTALLQAEAALEKPPTPSESLLVLDDAQAIQTDSSSVPDDAAQDDVAQDDAADPEPDAETEIPAEARDEAPPNPLELEAAAARNALSQKLSLLLWDQSAFEELLVIDPNGVVVASTFGDHAGKSAASLEYFERGRKATFVQRVFLSPITEELAMVVSTPIRNADGADIGVLAARLNLKEFFRLINDLTGLGESGETIVGKKIDQEVLYMAPTRHDDQAALMRKVSLGGSAESALQDAARGQSGRGLATDYRGHLVFAAWEHAPSLEWGVVTKIDYAEAAAPIIAVRNRIIVFTLVLGLLVVAASLLASRALVKPLRSLKDATDRISKGDFAVQLDIRSNDEIGELADSFERMVAAIRFFREQSHSSDSDSDADRDADSDPDHDPTRAG